MPSTSPLESEPPQTRLRRTSERIRTLRGQPNSSAQPPLAITWKLATAAAGVHILALGLFFAFVPETPTDVPMLIVGGAVIFILSIYSMPTIAQRTIWSGSNLIALGMVIVAGPAGGAVAAIAIAVGCALRHRSEPFKIAYNVSGGFLSYMAAWAIFSAANIEPHRPLTALSYVAGTLAGGCQFAVAWGLVGVMVHLSVGIPFRQYFASSRSHFVMGLGLGFASLAFPLRLASGDSSILNLAPIFVIMVVLQWYLVSMARADNRHHSAYVAYVADRERLIRAAITVADEERVQISRDLHDGVVQHAAALALQLSTAARKARRGGADGPAQQFNDFAMEATHITDEIRGHMAALAPPTLLDRGLADSLSSLLVPLRNTGIGVNVDLAADLDLSIEQQTLLYRVLQELIRNVTKHAHAKTVIISISRVDGQVVTRVSDNGIGCTAAQRAVRVKEGHVGLWLLEFHAKMLGGSVDITSEPGAGTQSVICLPWKPAA